MFAYVQHRVPEISDDLHSIDSALRAGFGWKEGPFEIWNYLGVNEGVDLMKSFDFEPAEWITEMVSNNNNNFYKTNKGLTECSDKNTKSYLKIPGQDGFIILKNSTDEKVIWSNKEARLIDIGDDILNLEFGSKMNSINQNIIQALDKSIDLAESSYKGLVLGNESPHFSAGADISVIFLAAVEQEYDELNYFMKMFQNTMMKLRYSSIPVIGAPHGYTLGGGCEVCLHCDKLIAYSETYIGLVEVGVGLVPGGGGLKEMALRASETFRPNDVEVNLLQEYFINIGMAKTATSAYEGFDLDYLVKGRDNVVMNKKNQISIAKNVAINMHDMGYTKPIPKRNIKVLGKQGLGMLYVGADSMLAGGYISEHDKKIANKIANVLCGGELSQATLVSEQYLLDLEREAFLSLCGEKKTLERIQYMLKNGKPLRN